MCSAISQSRRINFKTILDKIIFKSISEWLNTFYLISSFYSKSLTYKADFNDPMNFIKYAI